MTGLVRLPDGPARGWMVSVHGISRRGRQQAELMAPVAQQLGLALAAPRFPRERFADYQRLGRSGRGERADLALCAWLDWLAEHGGPAAGRIGLLGYSGGAQFVHRFALAHPQRVRGYVAAAAGWYTWPDAGQRYPYGTRHSAALGATPLDLIEWLGVPAVVAVGEHDNGAHSALRVTERVTAAQGASRLARAQAWVEAMNRTALDHGQPAHFSLDLMAGAGHSFRACVERGGLRDVVLRAFERW